MFPMFPYLLLVDVMHGLMLCRGVGAAMSEGRDAIINRDKDSYNQASANVNVKPPAPGTGEVRTHNPWVSSRLASVFDVELGCP